MTNMCLLHCHVDFLIHANLLVFNRESHRRNELPPRMVMVFVIVHILICELVENGGQAYKKSQQKWRIGFRICETTKGYVWGNSGCTGV